MKQTIAVKLDVTKIDKAKLYKGEKGTYLDAVILFDSDADQYGQNGMIVQSVSKEERAAGVKGAILGNVKLIGGATAAHAAPAQPQSSLNTNNDLPF